jgi:hypothetical protein
MPPCQAGSWIAPAREGRLHPSGESFRRADRRGGTGMAEIIFELRLIFPQSHAAADYQRG